MATGVTRSNRVKLSQLRGKGAKAAQDAKVLAETAILGSMKDKAVNQTIHVPSAIPGDVAKLMKDNELENATIIFSHQAISLFSHIFGSSMQTAVEQALTGMEARIEAAIERKLTETVKYASNAVSSLLNSMREPKDSLDTFAREFYVVNRNQPARAKKEPTPETVVPEVAVAQPENQVWEIPNDELEANIRKAIRLNIKLPNLGGQRVVANVFSSRKGEEIAVSEVLPAIKDMYDLDMNYYNMYTTLETLVKKGIVAKVAGKKGFYIHR